MFHNYKQVVITQADGDMGDGLQRTAMYYIGLYLLGLADTQGFLHAVQILRANHDERIPIRDPVRWNDPFDVSRDQEDPWLIALFFYGHLATMRFLIFRRWRRFGLYSNGDLTGPVQVANDFRLLNWWWLYPVICIFDFGFVIGAIQDCIWGRIVRGRDGTWLDMDNAVTRLAFTERVMPTPFSRASIWIYDHGFPKTPAGRGLLSALSWKHRTEAGANPELAKLWAEVWQSRHFK